MWIVEPRELKNTDNTGSGIFHLVCSSDEGGGTAGCCSHPHRTPAEASECPDARANADRITGIRSPTPRPTPAQLARLGYDAYKVSTGGKTFDGRDMPTFDAIADLTPHVARAWEAAAEAIAKAARE